MVDETCCVAISGLVVQEVYIAEAYQESEWQGPNTRFVSCYVSIIL